MTDTREGEAREREPLGLGESVWAQLDTQAAVRFMRFMDWDDAEFASLFSFTEN